MRFQSSTRPRAAPFWLALVTAGMAIPLLAAGDAAAHAGFRGSSGGYGHRAVHARRYGFGGYGHHGPRFYSGGHFARGPAYYYAPRYHYYPYYPYRRGFSVSFSIGNFPPAGHYYFDPYCDLRFSTLDLYLDHLGGYAHAPIIHAIEIDGGYPVYAYRYGGGRWGPCGY